MKMSFATNFSPERLHQHYLQYAAEGDQQFLWRCSNVSESVPLKKKKHIMLYMNLLDNEIF
jgi:hypothetical protein